MSERVPETQRGRGSINNEIYKEERKLAITPDEAKNIGGDIIVRLEEMVGPILEYDGRFTRVRPDEVSFTIQVNDGTREGRRFEWDRDGHLQPPPLEFQTQAQKDRLEIDGYILREPGRQARIET